MSDDAVSQLDMPRSQAGPNPQHLLVTLLGDYWHDRTTPLPSAAIVELLGEFGFTAASARSTLSRLARRGILELVREGRTTSYRVKREFLDAGAWRAGRILRFGAEPAQKWDGSCVIVTFSMPDEDRRHRDSLRPQLRSRGFAPLQGGAWISVRAQVHDVREALSEAALPGVAVFAATLAFPLGAEERRALVDWPLERVGALYAEFADRYAAAVDDLRRGMVSPAAALRMRTELMDEWRTFVRMDPDLPADFLPDDFPRARARAVFETLYDGLAPLAVARYRQIVADHEPSLAEEVSVVLAGSPPSDAE